MATLCEAQAFARPRARPVSALGALPGRERGLRPPLPSATGLVLFGVALTGWGEQAASPWLHGLKLVAVAVVAYSDDRRFQVPVVLVCPEYTPEQAASWIDGGNLPELAQVARLSYADIDSGHWPMVSRPIELARILHDAAMNLSA